MNRAMPNPTPTPPKIIKPHALKKGDKIGVFSPSSYVEEDEIHAAKNIIEQRGYEVYLHPQYKERHNQSAGTHEQKIEALHDLIADPSIKAIIAAGGGNRALHILDMIDYDLIAQNPKIISGFSDVTALLNAITAKTGLITFHGPVFSHYGHKDAAEALDYNLALMSGETCPYKLQNAKILREGEATGPPFGGNLSIFHLMPNTAYAPPKEGAIIFLEDIREEINKVDRMLLQLRRTGVLKRASGLICGGFTKLGDNGRPYGFTLEDLLLEHTEGLDIPVITDAPFGHFYGNYTLPVGAQAHLSAQDHKASLNFTNPVIS